MMKNISLQIAVFAISLIAFQVYAGDSQKIQNKEPTGNWVTRGERLAIPDSSLPVQNFGNSVAAKGNWLFIGGRYLGPDRDVSEAVFVYHWQSSHWKNIQVLSTDKGSIGYGFALGTNIAFISGYLGQKNSTGSRPIIFIYKQNDGQWRKTGILPVQSNGALAYNGRYLFSRDENSGTITIFYHRGSKWFLMASVKTQIHEWPIGPNFSVAENRLIVLSYGMRGLSKGHGAVYVYDHRGKYWARASVISPTGQFKNWNFTSCAISHMGNAIYVIANRPMPLSKLTKKPVYKLHRHIRVLMYEERNKRWKLAADGKPTRPSFAYSFGKDLLVNRDELFVGAPSASIDNRGYSNGLVYVFRKKGTRLIQVTRLSSGNPEKSEGFGNAFAETKNMLIVGAPFANTTSSTWHSGAAYIFDGKNGK